MKNKIPQIIIVGGGAGGLELATKLGKKYGRNKQMAITLVDATPTHLWKPLLHEVAAGTLDSHEDELNYFNQANTYSFRFCLGTLQGLKRDKKQISLAPIVDEEQRLLISERILYYDILVIAIGSIANNFNIPGAQEYCYFLDSRQQADHFQHAFLRHLLRFSHQSDQKALHFAIVGGGATGVELVAELHYAMQQISGYGLAIKPETVNFYLIEAGDKLLSNLPDSVINDVTQRLTNIGIKILTQERVNQVVENGLHTQSGKFIPADMIIWTAGIKAADFLKDLDGLSTNALNQLIVQQTLQTTSDNAIFAFGDCAYCPQINSDKPVPPRAQAAHQQADFLVKTLKKYLQNKPLPYYHYRDYGSLISLGHYRAIGNIMNRTTKDILLKGKTARFAYLLLYKSHQVTLYGLWRVVLLTLADLLSRRLKPRLKLH